MIKKFIEYIKENDTRDNIIRKRRQRPLNSLVRELESLGIDVEREAYSRDDENWDIEMITFSIYQMGIGSNVFRLHTCITPEDCVYTRRYNSVDDNIFDDCTEENPFYIYQMKLLELFA